MMREDEIKAPTALLAEIKYCAITYCASPNTEPETLKESVRFVLSQYGHLNVAEIREAFRLTAAGKIEANLNAYHGQFTIRILGDVLSGYNDMRTQVAREVRARLRAEQDAEQNKIFAQFLSQKFGTLGEQYQQLVQSNSKYSRWQDLPGWFCERIVREDVPGFTIEEKGKAWINAKHLVVNNLGFWSIDPSVLPADRKRYRAAAEALKNDPETFPEDLRKEAEEAYCKMLVFEKIAVFEKPKP